MSNMRVLKWVIAASVLLVSLQCTQAKGDTGSYLTREERNRAIAGRWVRDVWNRGDSSAVDELFAADFVSHYPGFPTIDRESYKQWMAMEFATFADVCCTCEDLVAEGDKVAIRWTWRGKHSKDEYRGIAPAGRELTMTGMTILRFEDGKIAEEWGNSDELGKMQQLGAFTAFGDESGDTVNTRNILMIIADENFRDEELFVPKKMFENKGMKVTVASTITSTVTGMLKGKIEPDVLLGDVEVKNFDAVVFVGGIGARIYYEDRNAHKIAGDAVNQNKVLSAICIAPNILANAGLLKDRKATCWDSANLTTKGAKYQKKNVVTDGKIITADGPTAASEFAEAIIKALSDESSNETDSPDKI